MSSTSVTSANHAEPEPDGDAPPTEAAEYPTAPERVARDTSEQERQLIGYVLAYPAAASDAVLALPAEHMSSERHATLWKLATERSYAGHEQLDMVTITNRLRDESPLPGLAEQAQKYILQSGINIVGVVGETLAEEISKGHGARMTEQALLTAWQRLAAGYDQQAREIMTSVDPDAGVRDQWVTLTEAWEAAKVDAENPAAVIPFPWAGLNRVYEGGMRAKQIYAVIGGPGTGKTAGAQQVVAHAAEEGRTCAVFSLEMGREDLSRRQMSTSGGVAMSEVMRTGLDLTKDSIAAVDGVLDRIGGRILIDDSEELAVSELRARGRVAVRRYKAELLAVDYTQLVEHDNPRLSEYERISEVIKQITWMAKELRVPVLLLVQPNRNASYQGRKIELHDAHGSSAIEKFAAGAIILNKVWDEDDQGNRIPTEFVDFDVRKNRFGANDVTLRMLADFSRQRFEEL